MNKLVSVIIPYYKKIKYIKNTINSVLNQNYKNIEILIIYDDPDRCDYYFLKKNFKNKKIKFFLNKHNLGAGKSRNLGIKKSKGEYIAFIDADDTWKYNKIKQQLNFMVSNKISFSFTSYKKKMNKSIIVKSEKKILYYKDLLDNCVIGLSTVMLKKKTIPHNLFSNLNTQEDLDAWLKLTKKKINAYFFDDILTCWNSTPQSLSKNTFQKIQDLWKVLNNQTNLKTIKKILIFINLSLNAVKRKF